MVLFSVSLFILCLSGCGGEKGEESPATHFNNTQKGTTTPHGTFVDGSAEDDGNGKIIFKTNQGATMITTPEKQGESVKYTDTKPIEESN